MTEMRLGKHSTVVCTLASGLSCHGFDSKLGRVFSEKVYYAAVLIDFTLLIQWTVKSVFWLMNPYSTGKWQANTAKNYKVDLTVGSDYINIVF